jgi:hypothetical protein
MTTKKKVARVEMASRPERLSTRDRFELKSAFSAIRHRYPFPRRDERSEDEVRQREHHVEVVEVPFVVHMVVRVYPDKPSRFLKPPSFGDMHAKVEIFVKEIIEAEGRHRAEENG